jgi:hypothetical protein
MEDAMRTRAFFYLLAVMILASTASATPPIPALGTAVVDGEYGEWNLTHDFFADMYRAGNPNKPLESKLYLRYDCSTNTLYALVLCEPGVVGCIDSTATTAWIAIGDQTNKVVNEISDIDGIPPDFAWIDRGFDGNPWHVHGYEASFTMMPGIYIIIAHVDIWDISSQTSATMGFPGSGPELVILDLPSAVQPATLGGLKALYR